MTKLTDGRTCYDIAALTALIGHRVRAHGQEFQIIEVLEDGPSLVLQQNVDTVIQPDQLGEAHRRVPETLVIAILTSDQCEFSTEFLDLDLLSQSPESV